MMVKLFLKVRQSLLSINKYLFFFIFLIVFSNVNSESFVKAGDSLIWDSENKSYTALGDVEFKNDKFIAFSDKMLAYYKEEKK